MADVKSIPAPLQDRRHSWTIGVIGQEYAKKVISYGLQLLACRSGDQYDG